MKLAGSHLSMSWTVTLDWDFVQNVWKISLKAAGCHKLQADLQTLFWLNIKFRMVKFHHENTDCTYQYSAQASESSGDIQKIFPVCTWGSQLTTFHWMCCFLYLTAIDTVLVLFALNLWNFTLQKCINHKGGLPLCSKYIHIHKICLLF